MIMIYWKTLLDITFQNKYKILSIEMDVLPLIENKCQRLNTNFVLSLFGTICPESFSKMFEIIRPILFIALSSSMHV
jgi:hypothetical protein